MMSKDHPLYECRNEKMYKKDVGTLAEYPFFYDGMTAEEYEEEREYYWKQGGLNFETYKTYKPLWKQRREEEQKKENK